MRRYGDYLTAQPYVPSLTPPFAPTLVPNRPHPLLFSGVGCSGVRVVDYYFEPTSGETQCNQQAPNLGSLWVPPGWQVQLQYTNTGGCGGTVTETLNIPSDKDLPNGLPVLIANTTDLFYSSGQQVVNQVSQFILTQPQTAISWSIQMCTNQINTVVGARHLTSWAAGSEECDATMDTKCLAYKNVGCAPNSTEPAPLPAADVACVCLVEENCLRETFCSPGSTNPNCANASGFQEFIPVTCFGKNCSVEG